MYNFLFNLANFFMLGKVADSYWEALAESNPELNFLKPIVQALESILVPVLIVVATAGSIYAVYLGIMMAKAEDTSKREEARKRVINAVIALVVVVVLILLLTLFITNIPNWFEVSTNPI